ncbi:MAG: xanthine dehydrogenase family protein molybdopterin-binding subunit [Rhodospirillales bacterium]|nr:xanthine dehydrogenase family protein molybdopterin-binding subunit [Rhodospirillales bacterium]
MTDPALDRWLLDRPNSYIGRSVPRPNAPRLTEGRGAFVDDIETGGRTGHAAFVRSPHAHARIGSIDAEAARAAPGVIAVVNGRELAEIHDPWVGVLSHLKGLKSAPQYALPLETATWQGEAVVAVVAESRARAEDAAELVTIDWEVLPAVTDAEAALDPATTVIHESLGDNLAWRRNADFGDIEAAYAEADHIVEETYVFARHTGVCVEPRAILADWNPGEEQLTVWHNNQCPHMVQNILATHFRLDEHRVRVIARDVGGSFGIKVHTYADEIATVGLSILLKRPVKFVADRLESFLSDIHARDQQVRGKVAVKGDGTILGFEIDALSGIGPYSMYPRTSGIESNQIVNLMGGPYAFDHYRAQATVVFQNKNMMCQYRAVGHPVKCAVTEGLVDAAARATGLDPAEIRRRNLRADDSYPCKSAQGLPFENLSHQASLAKLLDAMDYDALKAERDALRAEGVYRGIGLASFIEVTNPSAMFYGVGGARISAQDGATMRLDARGNVFVATGATEQGQGMEAVISQVAATAVGVPPDRLKIVTGDTEHTPYGGGTWASRAAGIGGEAVAQAGRALRQQILRAAAVMLQEEAENLDIRGGVVVDTASGAERIGLDEVGRVCYYRPDTLPDGFQSELVATRHYVPRKYPFAFTNGAQASYLEVDVETGFISLLDHWCIEDCGTVINPQLVDEQIRGGIVQGLGGALWEQCVYDGDGQMLNANMADYLVPMAAELPDMRCGHVVSPTFESDLGAKGVGEAGTCGAPAAVMNALNDALAPFAARLTDMPFTPQKVLRALGRI